MEDKYDDRNGFHYEMLGIYNQKTIDSYLNRFQQLKVPTGKFEKVFFYFKKYPKEFLSKSEPEFDKKSAYEKLKRSNTAKKLNLNAKPTQPSKISVKTFDNPLLRQEVDRSKIERDTTKKIAEELPDNRTVLVVNFDKKYQEDYIKKIFGLMGQIRRVFSGSILKKSSAGTG